MGDVLGKGGFGVVYKATYKGGDVAVKTLLTEAMSVENYQGFLKEIEIMRCVSNFSLRLGLRFAFLVCFAARTLYNF